MCGIIGYSGHRSALPLMIEGLHRLEYRGYDSAGVGFVENNAFTIIRTQGKLGALEEKIHGVGHNATSGIGHTRWATHGVPAERNAHPHLAGRGTLAIIHNGIIENYQELRQGLLAEGYNFASETDTEVLACLIESERAKTTSMRQAFAAAMRMAHGAYSVVMQCLEEPQVIYASRLATPLILGIGQEECFVASDIPAFLPWTRDVVFLDDGDMVRLENNTWEVLRIDNLAQVDKKVHRINWDMQSARKDGHKHFMLKEILEQPRVMVDCLAGRLLHHNGNFQVNLQELDAIPRPAKLHIVACGTSYHAGLWGKYLLEQWAGIPVNVEIASEFRYREPLLASEDCVLVISQSGETLDTLAALRQARGRCKVIAISNVMGSSVSREADATLFTQAGPEISVASTKALCSQMIVLLLMAVYYAQKNPASTFNGAVAQELLSGLSQLPRTLEAALPAMHEQARNLAPAYSNAHSFFFLGRGLCWPLALEGALKLKELSYIHAEGFAAGEMKHGPIALIDSNCPTLALVMNDALLPKVCSNIQEVQARRGKVIALANPGAAIPPVDNLWEIPPAPPALESLLALPALQLFSYEMADYLGKDVDQPRNLAKSVTVE